MTRRASLCAVAVGVVLALPLPSLAGGGARNLVVTAQVRSALRHAFLAAHRKLPPRRVKGPLRGTAYYGRYRGREYAFADFSIPVFGTQDQPELFRRPVGGGWRDLGDTGGDICPPSVPLPLLQAWHLRRSSRVERNGRSVWCYAP
jgi:hypothetical protein